MVENAGGLESGSNTETERHTPLKVVVAGPPHSGKSVFLSGLKENLPRDQYYLFRAVPDGEGTWLQRNYDDESVRELRNKGTFSEENVDWYANSLRECNMADLVLVDIGGIPSEENSRILREGGVTHAIILSGDKGKIPEWEEFLKNCGVTPLAILHSDYDGMADIVEDGKPIIEGSVHHLERGEDVSARPAIEAVAQRLTDHISERTPITELLDGNRLTISAIVQALGKEEIEKELPNGRKIKTIDWKGDDLIQIAELLHNKSGELPSVVDLDGPGPAWLHAALVHEVHPSDARLNSPDGFVGIGCQKPSGDGSGVEWRKSSYGMHGGKKVTMVEFQLDPSVPLSPEQLDEIAPPEVDFSDVVLISGRGPNWLTASVAMAYHGRAAAAACFQPGVGGTVSWTHSSDVRLGENLTGDESP